MLNNTVNKIKLSNYGFNILQIESIAACNMACSFCPYPLKDDFESKLSIQEIKKILDQVDSNDDKFKYVTFSQFNEPLLDKRIFEIIEYAQNCKLKVLMVTNGLLLNKEKNIDLIKKLKPDMKISLQVLDKNLHKEARGLNMELDNYVKTIVNFCKKIKDEPINVIIDIGSNFNNNKFNYFLRKILGFTTGDPSIPIDIKTAINQFKKYMTFFYEISDKEYRDKLLLLTKNNEMKNLFDKKYIYQEGFKIYNNVTLNIKPFWYGRRIKDFKPINENAFSCKTSILGVLSDGNVVPCCLAYDDSISLGKINSNSLYEILHQNEFMKNLRKKNGSKHVTCRKCFGAPTNRGVFFKNIVNKLPKKLNSKIINIAG